MEFFKGKNKPKARKVNQIFELLCPVLLVFRCFAKASFILKKGRLEKTKFFSIWTFYWATLYIVHCYVAFDLALAILNSIIEAQSSFVNDVKLGLVVLYTIPPIYVMPLAYFTESPRMIDYINGWSRFQEDYFLLTGKHWKTKIKKRSVIIAELCVCAISLIELPLGENRTKTKLWHQRLFYSLQILILLSSHVYWYVCLIEKNYAASVIREMLLDSPDIVGIRNLWTRLAKLHLDFGSTIGLTTIAGCSICCFVIIASAYGTVHSIINNEISRQFSIFFPTLIYNLAFLFGIIEVADRATNKIGSDIYDVLVSFTRTTKDFVKLNELKIFLQLVKGLDPQITLSGLVTVRRSGLITLFENFITYLIILIQFSLNSGKLNERKTNEPST